MTPTWLSYPYKINTMYIYDNKKNIPVPNSDRCLTNTVLNTMRGNSSKQCAAYQITYGLN